jgi:hypothetical protein
MSLKLARKKYVETGKINKEEFNKLKEAVPFKAYKYMIFICELYLHQYSHFYIKFITKSMYNLDKRNKYNMYNPYQEFSIHKMCTDVEAITNRFIRNSEDVKSHELILRDDEEWKIVVPLNKTSSIKYGYGAKWCTAATESKNYFYYHVYPNGTLYYFQNKKLSPNAKRYKMAVHSNSNGITIWDAPNDQIYSEYTKNKLSKLLPQEYQNFPILNKEFEEISSFSGVDILIDVDEIKITKNIDSTYDLHNFYIRNQRDDFFKNLKIKNIHGECHFFSKTLKDLNILSSVEFINEIEIHSNNLETLEGLPSNNRLIIRGGVGYERVNENPFSFKGIPKKLKNLKIESLDKIDYIDYMPDIITGELFLERNSANYTLNFKQFPSKINTFRIGFGHNKIKINPKIEIDLENLIIHSCLRIDNDKNLLDNINIQTLKHIQIKDIPTMTILEFLSTLPSSCVVEINFTINETGSIGEIVYLKRKLDELKAQVHFNILGFDMDQLENMVEERTELLESL